MRITAKPDCPDHWHYTFRGGDEFDVRVTLDGVLIEHVAEADDVAGYVVFYKDSNERHKPIQEVRREGTVVITGTKQPWLAHA